jgi:hypothetical protein
MANLYQQGTQKIEVVIRKESDGISGLGEIEPENFSAANEEKEKRVRNSRRARLIKTNLTHGLAATHQVAGLLFNYSVGGIGDVSGDRAYQNRVQRTVEQVQDGTNIATSIVMGASYGSWGGVIGAAFGMLFGAATSITSMRVKYANRERDYDFKVFKENNAIEYNRARAGINLTTGRLR